MWLAMLSAALTGLLWDLNQHTLGPVVHGTWIDGLGKGRLEQRDGSDDKDIKVLHGGKTHKDLYLLPDVLATVEGIF